MLRKDFQDLAETRLREAKQLMLGQDCHQGAYYLAGYAVECALKACIAKQTQQYEFPPQDVNKTHYTHDLSALVKTAKLDVDSEIQSRAEFKLNWLLVKGWNEKKRYETNINKQQAEELIAAIEDPAEGVLAWIQQHW